MRERSLLKDFKPDKTESRLAGTQEPLYVTIARGLWELLNVIALGNIRGMLFWAIVLVVSSFVWHYWQSVLFAVTVMAVIGVPVILLFKDKKRGTP